MAPYDGIKVDSEHPWFQVKPEMDNFGQTVDAIIYHLFLKPQSTFRWAQATLLRKTPEAARGRTIDYMAALQKAIIDVDLIADEAMRAGIKEVKEALGKRFAPQVTELVGIQASVLELDHALDKAGPTICDVQGYIGHTSGFDGVRVGFRSEGKDDDGENKRVGVELLGGVRFYCTDAPERRD